MSRNPTLNHKAGATFELACSLEAALQELGASRLDARIRARLGIS